MTRALASLAVALCLGAATLVGGSPEADAQGARTVAGKGEKVCRVKLKYSGQTKTWVCKKEEPCCVWHEINYVKCGSTITGCL
jgi:hypothetical protein